MQADPKRKSHRDNHDRAARARRHREEALDDALKNTFPASDPVSIEQPIPPTDRTGEDVKEAFPPQRPNKESHHGVSSAP